MKYITATISGIFMLMISYFHKTTKNGELKKLDAYKSGSWVSIVGPKHDELYMLASGHNLNSRVLLDVLDEDEMPRLEWDGKNNYLFTRFVYHGDEINAETQVVLLVLSNSKIISVSSVPIPKVENLTNSQSELDSTKSSEVFLKILHLVIDSYDRQLTKISRQVKNIRQRLRVHAIKNQDFVDFVVIEEELNEFLTVLTPTSAVLKRLLLGNHIKLDAIHQTVVEDLMLNAEQSIVESQSILQSIVNIREAYSTIATNNLNKIIRVLTVVTTVLAVPTLIASLYGMNVKLPIATDENAFGIVLVSSATISLILLLIFKLKKWL